MDSQFPSWVPDWEVHRPSSPFLLHRKFATMKAAGSTQASCTFFLLMGLTLLFRGIAFDQVAYVGDAFLDALRAPGPPFPESDTANVPLRFTLGQTALDFLAKRPGKTVGNNGTRLNTDPTGGDVLDAFIKNLVAADAFFLDLARERLRPYYTAWRKHWRIAGVNTPKFVHSTYERNNAEGIALAT